MMRILGVDPGTRAMGLGLVVLKDGREYAEFVGTIMVHPKLPLPERLKEIYFHVKKVIEDQTPTVLAIETCFHHALKDFKTAVRLGEARSVALLAAAEAGIETAEYPPARVKQSICGNGRASKEQIQYMVRKLLRLDKDPQTDAADALSIALCHLYSASKEQFILAHR